jgi:hypothetical protein
MIFTAFHESSLFSTVKKVMLISAAVFVLCPVMGMEQEDNRPAVLSAGSPVIKNPTNDPEIGLPKSARMPSSQEESSTTVTPSFEDLILGKIENSLTTDLAAKEWGSVTKYFFDIVMIYEGILGKNHTLNPQLIIRLKIYDYVF